MGCASRTMFTSRLPCGSGRASISPLIELYPGIWERRFLPDLRLKWSAASIFSLRATTQFGGPLLILVSFNLGNPSGMRQVGEYRIAFVKNVSIHATQAGCDTAG